MNKDKLIELADAYDQILGKQHVTAISRADKEGPSPRERLNDPQSSRLAWKAENLSHARWMCGQVKELAEKDVPKANRFLGFVQGILWTMGLYTINEMRGHNG
jgi:hypothetical protein